MSRSSAASAFAVFALLSAPLLPQEPTTPQPKPSAVPSNAVKPSADGLTAASITGSKQDPAAVERGGKAFLTNCAGCHGTTAQGGPGAPSLVRSTLVLDDEKGLLIGSVLHEGRLDKGMPRFAWTDSQIQDVAAWLHARTYAAGHRTTYAYREILTGDPAKGKAYFEGAGQCAGCHSASKDLAGIGRKYDPLALQGHWLQPKGAKPKVAVTLPGQPPVSGTLDRIDDFHVSLREASGQYRSFTRDPNVKVSIDDPLSQHVALLARYSDADIHNVTAYLASLK